MTVEGGVLMLPVVKGRPGAAYFSLANGGDKPATLAAISVDGAARAEVHETKGGTMTPLAALEVKPGETVKFERGGKHVMAFDVAQTLKPGGTAEMTLTFADGDKISAPLKVETMTRAMDHGDHN
jgi:periplasmic copper chaperone A